MKLICDYCGHDIEPGWEYVVFNGNNYCDENCALDDVRQFLECHTAPESTEVEEAQA